MTPTVLGYIFGTVGTLIVAMLGYLGVRFTSKSARRASINTNSTEWERRYRYNAERHLQWDFMIMNRLQRVEEHAGIEEEIQPPPPLFPEPPTKEGN